jgi:hypothetical protein
MAKPGSTPRVLLAALLGCAAGALLGFEVPFLVCVLLDKMSGSGWVQVGWIFLFASVPLGATLGGVVGGILVTRRPRLFAALIALLAAAHGGYYLLSEVIDRPRAYVVNVRGEAGRPYVGVVMTDGERHELKGALPAQLEYRAVQFGLAIAPADAHSGGEIAVQVFVDGIPQPELRSEIGVGGELRSHGYAEWIGKTASNLWVMNPAEAAKLRNDPFEQLGAAPSPSR